MKLPFRSTRIVGEFGMGLVMQALLSGANFAVGLILIRRTNDLQYSYYVLAANAILLLTALQNAFVQPFIVTNITSLDMAGRRDLVGALIRGNRRWVAISGGVVARAASCLW